MTKKNLGFTIVEVLITLSILSLVLTLSYQALSVFVSAASKNRSQYVNNQDLLLTRLKLRSSITSLFDYYVPNEQGLKRPYFFQKDNEIQYISLSPMVFFDEPEVLVNLKVTEENANQKKLEVWECPLKTTLPRQLKPEPHPINESCILFSDKLKFDDVRFDVITFDLMQKDAYVNSEQNGIDNMTTVHILPQIIKVQFYSGNSKITWNFNTKIENKRKYYEMDGFSDDI